MLDISSRAANDAAVAIRDRVLTWATTQEFSDDACRRD
jgi:hypothetical protein